MLFGAFGAEAYIGTQTSDAVIHEMAVTYLRVCCICSVGIVFFSVFEKLLQAAGLSMQSNDRPNLGRNHQYHSRSYDDLRLARIPENGRSGSRFGNSDRLGRLIPVGTDISSEI